MFKNNEDIPVDNSRDYSKTKKEVIEERKRDLAQRKLASDLKPMYELIDKINHRLDILEEKFYIKFLTDKYIFINGNIIEGCKSELLQYLLDNLCKVGCENMTMQQMNNLSMMDIYYNNVRYKIPSIAQIEVEKIVHRMNELLAQTDCELFDIDYYEKTVHKKVEEYTKKDKLKEAKGINRNKGNKGLIIACIIVLFGFIMIMSC